MVSLAMDTNQTLLKGKKLVDNNNEHHNKLDVLNRATLFPKIELTTKSILTYNNEDHSNHH
jgi:hypothetical protein